MGSGLLSPGHLAIVLLIVLLVFGAKRLPELGRALGSGMREFKDSVTGDGEQPPALAEPLAPTTPADPQPTPVTAHDGQPPSSD